MADIRDATGAVIFTYPDALPLHSVELRGANLKNAVMDGAELSGADLSNACLEGANLYWAIFFDAKLVGTNLRSAILAGCDFKEANLSDADLTGANLGRDSVGGATQLQGANLSNCRIAGASFTGAEYDERTILPERLNPADHEMKLIKVSE
jgi:uncharacterized protein YjbI with pentapeptide repeats